MTKQIKTRAQSISQTLVDALVWTGRSEKSDISNNFLLKKDLKRSIAQCKRLESAANSKMCVGVYGASQAGKSYLVSVLASRPEQPLVAVFGDDQIDFLQHINPAGGQESTGLVTRFTVDRVTTPNGFPVQARLLSEMDLAKIFINSFAEDILASDDEDYDALQQNALQVIDTLEEKANKTNLISVEEVYELEDYFNSRLGTHPNAQMLKKIAFWDRAAELLPRMDLEERISLLQISWESLAPLTSIYRHLTRELSRIGSPNTVFCPIEALTTKNDGVFKRADSSIINVSTLEALADSDDTSIEIKTEQGINSAITVSTLCALIAELLIPLRDKPHDFFELTDLLDFPGARSRNPRPKISTLLSQGEVQVENFLRGKVAYLFDKFSADLQLTSMLLCVGPSNMEVSGLPRLVEEWVTLTHGQTPEDRAKLPTNLFLILTKFDQELTQDSGKQADGSRWSTRLEASLLKPFGGHSHRTGWVSTWTPETPFNNTYWLRNPNVDQFGLVEYEGEIASSREIGFAKERATYLQTLKQEFLRNTLVEQHFRDPLKAWDAAMRLNDGGVTYIVNALSEVCHPLNKLEQINERLSSLLEQRSRDLKKYFVSTDRDEVVKEKTQLAHDILKFGAMLLKKQRLGEFISFLLITDVETRGIFQRIQIQFEREKNALKEMVASNAETRQSETIIDDDVADLLGIETDKLLQTREKDELQTEGSDDFPDLFVVNFLNEWEGAVLARAAKANVKGYLHLDMPLLQKLLQEFERAAYRTGLVDNLKEMTRQSYQYRSSTTKSWILKQTSILTSIFNEFVTHGALNGSHHSHQQQINSFDGREIEVFSPALEPEGEVEVTELSSDLGKKYLLDWLHAVQSSIRMNGDFVAVLQGNTEENRQLGEILEKMESQKMTGVSGS